VFHWDYYYALYSWYVDWLTDEHFFDLIDELTSALHPWVAVASPWAAPPPSPGDL
jgi:hypothetical protein